MLQHFSPICPRTAVHKAGRQTKQMSESPDQSNEGLFPQEKKC